MVLLCVFPSIQIFKPELSKINGLLFSVLQYQLPFFVGKPDFCASCSTLEAQSSKLQTVGQKMDKGIFFTFHMQDGIFAICLQIPEAGGTVSFQHEPAPST